MRVLMFLVFLASAKLKGYSAEEIWEPDFSENVRTGVPTEEYAQVGLRCGAEKMIVEIKTTKDFSGVIYTQGNFFSQEPSCFLDAVGGTSFTMSISFDECNTEQDGEIYRNVVMVQHDDQLVTWGDATFSLECDFSKPRDNIVSADLNGSKKRFTRSSITLVDINPTWNRNESIAYIESESDEVVFVPNAARKINDEL